MYNKNSKLFIDQNSTDVLTYVFILGHSNAQSSALIFVFQCSMLSLSFINAILRRYMVICYVL